MFYFCFFCVFSSVSLRGIWRNKRLLQMMFRFGKTMNTKFTMTYLWKKCHGQEGNPLTHQPSKWEPPLGDVSPKRFSHNLYIPHTDLENVQQQNAIYLVVIFGQTLNKHGVSPKKHIVLPLKNDTKVWYWYWWPLIHFLWFFVGLNFPTKSAGEPLWSAHRGGKMQSSPVAPFPRLDFHPPGGRVSMSGDETIPKGPYNWIYLRALAFFCGVLGDNLERSEILLLGFLSQAASSHSVR